MITNTDKKNSILRSRNRNRIYNNGKRIQKWTTNLQSIHLQHICLRHIYVGMGRSFKHLSNRLYSIRENKDNQNQNQLQIITSPLNQIILFIFSLFLLYQLIKTPSTQPIRKHSLLVLWLTIFSVFTTPLAHSIQNKNPQALAQLTTLFLSIVTAASLFAVVFPNIIQGWWIFGLLISLIGLIIARIVFSISGITRGSPESSKLSMVAAVIFALFIAYDTKSAMVASKYCQRRKSRLYSICNKPFLGFCKSFFKRG